jgi:hypothetical protein
VRLVPHPVAPFAVGEPARFARVVAAAFGQRRKTLRNALRGVVDEAGFAAAFVEHQARSRAGAAARFAGGLVERNPATTRLHTATHLLQAALKQVVDPSIGQAGSLVDFDRLRFDFTHIAPMTPEELARVEQIVNRAIMDNIPVGREFVSQKEAVARGAMALFGEKYGDTVCLVEVPGVSMELVSE